MYTKQIEKSIEILRNAGVSIKKGLSEEELQSVEELYGIQFPPDYRAFLSACLPIGDENFTSWRNTSKVYTCYISSKMIDWTMEGVLYTVEKLGGWIPEWGERPTDTYSRMMTAMEKVNLKPLFIPIFAHRFISAQTCEPDHPVYSIVGSDVVCYGRNFWDYIEKEFGEGQYIEYDVRTLKEPIPHYNEFVYRNSNNFRILMSEILEKD